MTTTSTDERVRQVLAAALAALSFAACGDNADRRTLELREGMGMDVDVDMDMDMDTGWSTTGSSTDGSAEGSTTGEPGMATTDGGWESSGDESGACSATEGGSTGDLPVPPEGYPPGWIDKIELETCTQCNMQWWIDSDGVAPETPGCHQEYESECSTPTNDKFGEACEDGDILLETNPGAGVCHQHAVGNSGVGVGHPDRFSCSAYCEGMYGMWGRCVTDEDACGDGVDSAHCDCGC